MQTIESIKAEITQLERDHVKLSDYVEAEEKLKDKARKRIQLLKNCILYLETNPRHEFILKMKEDNERKLEIYDRRLKEFIASVPQLQRDKIKNLKTYYYKSVAPDEARSIKNCKD